MDENGERIAIEQPPDREIDWDRVGTPRDIVAVIKALGLNARFTAEEARRRGIERFVRQIER